MYITEVSQSVSFDKLKLKMQFCSVLVISSMFSYVNCLVHTFAFCTWILWPERFKLT